MIGLTLFEIRELRETIETHLNALRSAPGSHYPDEAREIARFERALSLVEKLDARPRLLKGLYELPNETVPMHVTVEAKPTGATP